MQGNRIIDVHSHMLFPSYLEGLKEMNINPEREDGFPTPSWSEEEHIAYMDSAGISMCILSLSTPHIHHGDGALACRLARWINDEAASLVWRHPRDFRFAGVLPLPEVQGSLEEISYCFDELGAVAVKIPSNSNGVYPGDPVLDPVFAELNKRKSVVLIHPSRPAAVPEHVFTAGPAPLFEYIADTTRAVLNLIAEGTLEKYPDIKFIVPHCGSFLPFVSGRLEGIEKVLVPAGMMRNVDVEAAVRKLYFDTAGDALPVALDALWKITDPSHILFGGDFPYTPVPMIKRNIEKLEQYEPVRPYLDDLFYGNAQRLFFEKETQ